MKNDRDGFITNSGQIISTAQRMHLIYLVSQSRTILNFLAILKHLCNLSSFAKSDHPKLSVENPRKQQRLHAAADSLLHQ